MWWAPSGDEAGGIWPSREGGGKQGEKTPKVRKAGRQAGHRLETAAICSVALGLRSGWGFQSWRPSPPPRPVPSATRARPWPLRPASPCPRGPGGSWDWAPLPAGRTRTRRRAGRGMAGLGVTPGGQGRLRWGATSRKAGRGRFGFGRPGQRAVWQAAPRGPAGGSAGRGGGVAAGGWRPPGGSLGAGWARRIAKGCGLARTAELRRKRAQEGGTEKRKKKKERRGTEKETS